MKKTTKNKLKAAGWKVGTVAEFLGLSKEDRAFVELKVALAKALRRRREAKGLTQGDVAKLVGSSQPRVAFMEASEASVSIDLLMRTLLAMGASLKELAGVVRSAGKSTAA
jgi:predicted XRE-type DNA-binding protein